MLGRFFRKTGNDLATPVLFNRQNGTAGTGDGSQADLARRKESLRKKFRQAFALAVALPVAAFSAHTLIENKDAETNLEKPGLVLTLKELFDQKTIDEQKKQAASQQRLDSICVRISQTEMGREILQYIKDNKVHLGFYDQKDERDRLKLEEGKLGTYFHDTNTLRLNPASSDDTIMVTLAHEARHAWQTHEISSKKIEARTNSPDKKLLLQRYIEADAFAYQTAFALDYERATGKRLQLGRNLEVDKIIHATDAEMRDRLRRDLIDGLNEEQARLNVLRLGFGTLQDRGYDKKSIEDMHQNVSALLEKSALQDASSAPETKQLIAQGILEKERIDPDWNALIGSLRKFGNMSLKPNSANYLKSVPDKDIISLEWMGGLSDIRAPQFREIRSKYAQVIAQSIRILDGISHEEQAQETQQATSLARPVNTRPNTPESKSPL